MKFKIEFTDTFAGEPNYGFVRKAHFDAPADASQTLLVRRGKKALNMTGWLTRTETWGDMLALLPRDGAAVIAFITTEEGV